MNNNIENSTINQQYQNYLQQVKNVRTAANILAGTSLACMAGSKILNVLSVVFYAIGQSDVSSIIISLVSGLASILNLAGLVTMIVTRVKYPENILGKVAMWTYIALVIVEVIFFILFAIACIAAGVAIIEACQNCPG